MSRFPGEYLSSYYVGTSLGDFLLAFLRLAQGASTFSCQYNPKTGENEPHYGTPRFPVSVWFSISVALHICGFIAFLVVTYRAYWLSPRFRNASELHDDAAILDEAAIAAPIAPNAEDAHIQVYANAAAAHTSPVDVASPLPPLAVAPTSHRYTGIVLLVCYALMNIGPENMMPSGERQ